MSNMSIGQIEAIGAISNVVLIGLMVVIAAGILTILLYISSDYKRFLRFKRLIKLLKLLYRSTNYFTYGVLTILVVISPIALGYYLITVMSSNMGSIIPALKLIGIGVGMYVLITGVGYVFKQRVWKKIFRYWKISKQTKEAVWFNEHIGG